MTNVMHMHLIYLSVYFCITCFGLSFSPSSEAGVQLLKRQVYNFYRGRFTTSSGAGLQLLQGQVYNFYRGRYTTSSGAGVQLRQWFKSARYGVSAPGR
jgi:hypothetical protein